MDQVKIGKFIAEERKNKGYTQRQLADILGISDKTISKWECGNGFPEVSLLLPLCEELGISVNELLTGERISEDDYLKTAEKNMVKLLKKTQENKK
jgi:transcriptional regulator with XRE-family HTH domain